MQDSLGGSLIQEDPQASNSINRVTRVQRDLIRLSTATITGSDNPLRKRDDRLKNSQNNLMNFSSRGSDRIERNRIINRNPTRILMISLLISTINMRTKIGITSKISKAANREIKIPLILRICLEEWKSSLEETWPRDFGCSLEQGYSGSFY